MSVPDHLLVPEGSNAWFSYLKKTTRVVKFTSRADVDKAMMDFGSMRDTANNQGNCISWSAYFLAALFTICVFVLSILGASVNGVAITAHIANAIIAGVGAVLATIFKSIGNYQYNEANKYDQALRAVGTQLDSATMFLEPPQDPISLHINTNSTSVAPTAASS